MRAFPVCYFCLFIVLCIGAGCANIVPPSGGKKDITPPKIVSLNPPDSQLNAHVSKLEMHFNEYVTVSDVTTEVQVSPLLSVPLNVITTGKKITVRIPDTLLLPNTTYRISFNKSIKDLHEGNPMKPYTYVFSTGSYFDSMQLNGTVIDAATGKVDTGVYIMLYDAAKSDSVVVREKPQYITKSVNGKFLIQGLPYKRYKVFALKESNANLVYDGKGEEIGFADSTFLPTDSLTEPIVFRLFAEEIKEVRDTAAVKPQGIFGKKKKVDPAKDGFLHNVSVDTVTLNKGTFDITKPLSIQFNEKVDTINRGKVFMTYDSSGIAIEAAFTIKPDSVKNDVLLLNADWKPNSLYTLRLLKGFAKDSARYEAMPSRNTFRTKGEDDYGKLNIHLPSKYYGKQYILLVKIDNDTVHMKPVTDTMVHLAWLRPGTYSMFVISDKNENGKWDTGDLFEKRQPEIVIPYDDVMQLKAGWDSSYDFEKEVKIKPKLKGGASPQKRDNVPVK